jgi:hypothetical protein
VKKKRLPVKKLAAPCDGLCVKEDIEVLLPGAIPFRMASSLAAVFAHNLN